MLKKLNMLALIVLLVFQTMLTPVAATAQADKQEDPDVDTITEHQDMVNVGDEEDLEETEGSENEELDPEGEDSATNDSSGDENENGNNTNGEESDEDAETDGDVKVSDTNDAESEKGTEAEEESTEDNTSKNEVENQANTAGISVVNDSGSNVKVGEDEGEENAPENHPIDPHVEITHNIFEFEYFRLDGEDVENGAEIVFDTEYQLQYKWNTENRNAKAGDTARLTLPDVFKEWPEGTPSRPITTSTKEVVGQYTISNGELVFEFDEGIEDADVANGFVGFNVTFNNEKFLEEWEQEIDFDGKGEKTLTVLAKVEEVETSLDKEGHPDSDRDAREITWSVDVTNGSEEDIIDGVLKDILPEGVGEARDFVVKEFSYDREGNKIDGEEVAFNEPTVDAAGFELTFDNVPARGGYTVEYTTTITDYEISEFTNDATFVSDSVNLETDTTVTTGERSNPIQKEGTYNWNTGQIDWTIIVNENGMEIGNAIVHDKLPEEQTLVPDSIKVTKNWQATDIEADGFPITLGSVSADEVYRINFSTDIDWSKVNSGEYQHHNEFFNETELRDGENPIGEDDEKVDHWRSSLIEKSGNANDYNYEDKVLSWTVDVNKAKHPINDAVLTDILPAGLETMTFEDITIEGAEVDSEDVTITRNDDGTQTVVINLGNIDDEVTVSYQTVVEDFEENDFKNEASLGGDGIGVETPKDDATVNPPGNSFTKDFKGIDYSEKTIDWELSVNPQREAITELKIEDTFPNNGMILLPETISVKIGGTELEDTDYTLVPNTDGGETGYNKGFTIDLINISEDSPLNEVLTVEFKTSYDPQLEVDGNIADDHTGDPTLYTNHANFTGKTVNGNDFDRNDDAETRVREDSWNSGKKEGQLVDFDEDATERKIAWQVYTNYQKQNLGKGISVTDTLDYEGTIDEDSIVVSVYEVDKDGNTTITDQTINDYSTEVDGKEFTLTFDEEFEVNERYVIEFTTSVPDISEESYTNNAMLKVGEKEYPYTATVNYDRWDDFLDKKALGYSGNDDVFIGEELEWEVTVNESLSIIKDATIKDTISAGLAYLEDSLEITTGSETELVEGDDYTLTVTTTDAGETVLDIEFTNDVTEALTLNYTTVVIAEDGHPVNNKVELNGNGIENKSKETDSLTAKQFSWVGGEYNPRRGAIVVEKVDSEGNVIETGEANFELYFEMNDERILVGEYSTQDGILEIPNLPLRTYYLVEVAPPNGYVLTDEEIEVVVDKAYGSDQVVFDVPVTNYKEGEEPEPVEVSVEKIWKDADNQDGIRSESITVNLLANGEVETSKGLNEENNWSHVFTDLPAVDEDGNAIEYTVEEVPVEGYETTIAGTSADGFVITNTYEPELIDVEGTKTWDDADNQDGKRPDSITVNLLANGNELDSTDVTEATDWTFEFTDLPKFENGEEIKYTVQEDNVEDYSTEIDGFDITNSYTPGQTSINVVKAWEDADNQDGIRSDSITVKLLADGEETDREVELNEGNNWQADFAELDVYVAGEEITYTIEEVAVEGYETTIAGTSADGFVVTNTHEPELIDLAGTKTWEDADNQDGVRPDSITVNLLANGTKVDDVDVTEATDWTFEFTDLPKFENGEEIKYTVQEDNVEDYSTEIDGFDITNSYTPGQTSINVVKDWKDAGNQDGIRPEAITVKLLADGEETDKEVELNEGNNWQADFTDLDVYADGEEIVYTIVEVEVAGYVTEDITGNAADGFVITNTHEPELIDLAGTKTWEDADNQDGVRPDSITVNLLANGTKVDDVDVTEATDWTFEFTDLPKFENGEEIKYTVQEDNVEDYSTEIDGFDITNSYTPGQTSVNVVKAWEYANKKDGIRPDSITVKLLADGEPTGDEIELNTDNNWQADFAELDVYLDGEEIVYTVEEVAVDGYNTEITGNAKDGFTITNTQKTYAIGDYTWIDSNKDGIQDEDEEILAKVKVELFDEDGEFIAKTETDKNGRYIFDELPAGNYQVKFTLTEEQAEKYEFTKQNADENSTKDSDADPETGFTTVIKLDDNNGHLTKDYTDQDFKATEGIDPTWDAGVIEKTPITPLEPAKTTVSVEKVWEGEAQDKVTINLLADGDKLDSVELSEDNEWTHTFEGLPTVNEITDEKAIEYTVEEIAVDGYNTEVTGNAEEGFTITNTQKTYAIGDYTWIDANKDGIQDEDERVLSGVIVELYDESGENKIDETTTNEDGLYIFDELPAGKYTVKFTLTDEQKEKYVFTKQNADEDSTEDSDADPETGWTTVIKLDDNNEHLTTDYEDQDFKATEGIDPTWDAGVIEKTYAIGDYVWVDRNKDGIQDDNEEPLEGVTVELFDKDGEKVAETTTDKNGRYIFDELESGDYQVKFTLTEEQAKKYKFTQQNAGDDPTADSDADENGWTKEISLNDNNKQLTKEYEDQDFKATEGIDPTWDVGVIELVDITITKQWVDKDQSIRPDAITVDLLANGEKVSNHEVTADSTWTLTIEELDKYDTNGEEIVYTIEEHAVSEYNTSIDEFDITNTRKTYAIGDYTWIDSNKDGIQDEDEEPLVGVKVELFDEQGEKVAETTTDKSGRYIFDELESGNYKVKFTLTEEQAKKYKFTKQNAGKDSIVDSDADENGWTKEISLNEGNEQLTKEYEDQAFNASEGIDPTWDAGVVLQETPEDPKDPEEPQDPEDPKDPEKPTLEDPEDPKVGDTEGEIPKTATNMYNLTLIGFGLMLLGIILFIVRRKRIE